MTTIGGGRTSDAGSVTTKAVAVPDTKDMNPALRDKLQELKSLIVRSEPRAAYERYQIGCIIRDVRNDRRKYGVGSVAKLARALARDEDTLYEYADVAETWSSTEVARLLERKSTLGIPLSFSHLIEISRVRRDPEALKVTTARAFDGISVRQLRELVDSYLQPAGAGHAAPNRSLRQLTRLVRLSEGLIDSTRASVEWWSDLRTAHGTPELAALLDRAVAKQEDLRRACEQNVQQLKAEQARVEAELASEREPAQPKQPRRAHA
jgi:hypothetical protein